MNVDNFRSNFDGGSRPNRYQVSGKIGSFGEVKASTNGLLCRATSMPSATVGIMRVPFRGRVVKIPGDRTYEEWTCTFYDSMKDPHELHDKFWAWNNVFNVHETNVPGSGFAADSGVNLNSEMEYWTVAQLGMDGNPKRKTRLVNCWPTVVSEIALTYDAADTIAEFSVTFAYDYLELNPSNASPSDTSPDPPDPNGPGPEVGLLK